MVVYHEGLVWIDNQFPYLREQPEGHTHKIKMPVLWVAAKLFLGKVFG